MSLGNFILAVAQELEVVGRADATVRVLRRVLLQVQKAESHSQCACQT